jgi:hypothetical protein
MEHYEDQETEFDYSPVDDYWMFGLAAFGICCILFVALYYPTY